MYSSIISVTMSLINVLSICFKAFMLFCSWQHTLILQVVVNWSCTLPLLSVYRSSPLQTVFTHVCLLLLLSLFSRSSRFEGKKLGISIVFCCHWAVWSDRSVTGRDGWGAKEGSRGHELGVICPLSTWHHVTPSVSSAQQMLNDDWFLFPHIQWCPKLWDHWWKCLFLHIQYYNTILSLHESGILCFSWSNAEFYEQSGLHHPYKL